MDQGNSVQRAISAFFIGPHGENMHLMRKLVGEVLSEVESARVQYAPTDEKAITPLTQASPEFAHFSTRISEAIAAAAKMLAKHSIPYWSPRYGGHMCTDPSIPALLGYFMGMLYNPNNITPEVSPLTTAVEAEVGNQFCRLFGYNLNNGNNSKVSGWGHITCDGTVANIEAMWVARNLKYYPLSLKLAIMEGDLAFIADRFYITTCDGTEKLFRLLDTWELLNLRPDTVLDLPAMLYQQFGISELFLHATLEKYSIQNMGTVALNARFWIEKPMQFVLGKTNHYSWGKGGGILGFGKNNVVGIDVDLKGRVDLQRLKMYLQSRLDNREPLYAVVAIVGSTEVGAVDNVDGILELRRRFQERGLSFLVLADAAWGGYFTTMLPRDADNLPITSLRAAQVDRLKEDAPHAMQLSAHTESALAALRSTDSITVDPHKAGYVPYPAGGVVYRDRRMGKLVSCTGPYLAQGSNGSMGVNGLQGSKPGAAAMSIWLSNYCIGLNTSGYGALLAEVSFNSAKMSAHWATLAESNDCFICVPFDEPPIEKKIIRRDILHKSYGDILNHDFHVPDSAKIMPVLQNLGSDLNINTFALNWRDSNGRLNTDIGEANELMRRVVKRLSIDSPTDNPASVPFYLTSTEFSVDRYGRCLAAYKDRLGLGKSEGSLTVLRNTVMNPFMGHTACFGTIVKEFRKVVEEEIAVLRDRNTVCAETHSFYLQGTGPEVYLVGRPRFDNATHDQQVILAATLPAMTRKVYQSTKESHPSTTCWVKLSNATYLPEIITSLKRSGRFVIKDGKYHQGSPNPSSTPFPHPLTLSRIVAYHSLSRAHQDKVYPDEMPFYIYGTSSQWNISHIIVRGPKIVLNASNIRLELDNPDALVSLRTSGALILTFVDIHEASRQPFPAKNKDLPRDFFFRSGESFRVNVWKNPGEWGGGGGSLMERLRGMEGGRIAVGWVQLGEDVFVDVEEVNADQYDRKTEDDEMQGDWLDEFEFEKMGVGQKGVL